MVRQWIANPLSPVRIWVPPENLKTIILFLNSRLLILRLNFTWECGEIGRHDGLKIRCLVIGVRVQVPPFPINDLLFKKELILF